MTTAGNRGNRVLGVLHGAGAAAARRWDDQATAKLRVGVTVFPPTLFCQLPLDPKVDGTRVFANMGAALGNGRIVTASDIVTSEAGDNCHPLSPPAFGVTRRCHPLSLAALAVTDCCHCHACA